MRTRRLGKTNFEVSIIGLGGIPIQQCTQEEADKLIKTALEQGINFIDTARGYTISEELIGNALKQVNRDEVYVATKTMARTYEAAKADFEISYKNLGVEVIDLYQFHNLAKKEDYDIVMSEDGAMRFFKEMKEKGYIREIGITSHSADLMDIALDSGEFATMQFPVNAVEYQGLPLLEKAKKLDIGTIAMKPIAGGVLFNKGEQSLRYILENENLTVAIPGMYSVDEIMRNAEVGKNFRPLSDQERKELMEEADSLGNDFCRRCQYCAPCTVGIDIPGLFTLDLYLTKYNLVEWAKTRYENALVKASECIECGDCMTRCPYHLEIIDKLAGVSQRFEGV